MCSIFRSIGGAAASLVLAVLVLAVSVTIGWDPPVDPTGVVGYRVCTGSASGQYATCVDVGLGQTHVLESISESENTYVVVRSRGTTEEELSPPSNELCLYGPVDCAASPPGLLLR